MWISECQITLHEPLFFATREIGRLYETGRYLHNYALTYALGLITTPYHIAEHAPNYRELMALNDRGVYVTPAQPLQVAFQLATFKYGEEQLHVEMEQASRNTPSFGRAKELAVNSRFRCYVLSYEQALAAQLPRWIRLGKWMSKARLEVQEPLRVAARDHGAYHCPVPLNPLDLLLEQLDTFDIISMPPSSLVANARLHGRAYHLPTGALPDGLAYRFE